VKILFLDTSSFFVTVSIIEDNIILFNYQNEIRDDMSSKIMPIIREGFNKVSFNIQDIDRIVVVNGPGSFTGVRIGVTIAKVLAWTLKKEIITVSSLELMATTEFDTKYIIPMIDARRGYVYAGVYDNALNIIREDSYIAYNDLSYYFNESTIVSYDALENAKAPKIDIIKVLNKHVNDILLNPHRVNPNYLKKVEAEEKKEKENDKKDS
jgi:tRNA threonylcarbamoyladenosine biosynthesis protein TsaB